MRLVLPIGPATADRLELYRAASWRGNGCPAMVEIPELGPGRFIVQCTIASRDAVTVYAEPVASCPGRG